MKTFGSVTAVDDLSLDIPHGSFVTLLGASGSGKTTTLRMIGGFEFPDSGEVLIRGETMGRTPPHVRDTSMVFQNYALFPHMSVRENIAFGLRERKQSRSEVEHRVQSMLDLIELPDVGDRNPKHLSGGQQQRVAMARSLVIQPTVLLLDEPLGALDLMLRKQMQIELKRIQQQIGITFVYVTHDQEEALTISDRIVIMRDGRVEQEGSAEDVFDRPATGYVAEFMGAGNVLPVHVVSQDATSTAVVLAGRRLIIPQLMPPAAVDARLVIRPERIQLGAQDGWAGRILEQVYKGSTISCQVQLADGSIVIVESPHDRESQYQAGDAVVVDFRVERAHLVASEAVRQ